MIHQSQSILSSAAIATSQHHNFTFARKTPTVEGHELINTFRTFSNSVCVRNGFGSRATSFD